MWNRPPLIMPYRFKTLIASKVFKLQFLFSVKYAVKFCVVEARGTHIHAMNICLLNCQLTRKTSLICIFLAMKVTSMVVSNVLVEFEDTANSLKFPSDFEVLKLVPDSTSGSGPSARLFNSIRHHKTHRFPTNYRSVLKILLGYISY